MKSCHQQQMSECVAGSCCYFCVSEHESAEGDQEREMPGSTVLKPPHPTPPPPPTPLLPRSMLNPEMLSACSAEHSAAFLQLIALLQRNRTIKIRRLYAPSQIKQLLPRRFRRFKRHLPRSTLRSESLEYRGLRLISLFLLSLKQEFSSKGGSWHSQIKLEYMNWNQISGLFLPPRGFGTKPSLYYVNNTVHE